MHHRHKNADARRDADRSRRDDESRAERYDVGAENRGEPYYNEPDGGRFGEPRGRSHAGDIERGSSYGGARESRHAQDAGHRPGEYGTFDRYGDYRGGGRWAASPELPRHLSPAGPMAGEDPAHQRGAYYYGPRSDEDRRADYHRRSDYDPAYGRDRDGAEQGRYDAYGRDLGANGARPSYPGYAETQGHSAHGAESYRGRGPKGYARSDARIQEEVCERLTDDHRVDASDVTIATKDGVVTLEGTVPRRWMKHCAEDVAESCGGVTDVVNRLSVRRDQGGGASAPVQSGSEAGKKH